MTEDADEVSPRIKTGIPGFDDLVEGGFVAGSTILVRGGSGAGKTIFGLQFLHYGALNQEPGVILTLEESARDLRREAARFGWDLKELEKQRTLSIIEVNPWTEHNNYATTINKLENAVTEIKATRVVIDSLPAYLQYCTNDAVSSEGAKSLARLCWRLGKDRHATTLLITKMNCNGTIAVEEGISSGVIEMRARLVQGVVRRYMLVRKMRETQHSSRLYVYDFTPRGLSIFNPTSTSWTPPAQGNVEVAEEFL